MNGENIRPADWSGSVQLILFHQPSHVSGPNKNKIYYYKHKSTLQKCNYEYNDEWGCVFKDTCIAYEIHNPGFRGTLTDIW